MKRMIRSKRLCESVKEGHYVLGSLSRQALCDVVYDDVRCVVVGVMHLYYRNNKKI